MQGGREACRRLRSQEVKERSNEWKSGGEYMKDIIFIQFQKSNYTDYLSVK